MTRKKTRLDFKDARDRVGIDKRYVNRFPRVQTAPSLRRDVLKPDRLRLGFGRALSIPKSVSVTTDRTARVGIEPTTLVDLGEQGCYKRIEEYMGVAYVVYRGRSTSEIHKSEKNSDHIDEKEKEGNDCPSQHSR